METPGASGNATGSGSGTGGRRTYQCTVCDKVLGSEKTLEAHKQNHVKQFVCSDCGTSFGRQDQMSRHRYMAHGHNASQYICYIKGCTRSRQGMRSLDALVKHLEKSHQGATVDDNKQAAADRGFQLPEESSSDQDSENDSDDAIDDDTEEDDDINMTEEGDSSEVESEQQQETGEAHDHPLSSEYYRYRIQMLEERLSEAQDQLDKKDVRHAREIGDLHRFYQSKMQDREDELAEQRRG
ncbi:hypothetical protein PG985_014690 [Apiospora marii]|uniref:C2H2-type domain-containing protein n=1 Tax=Apiospora marii TaxID=335849 RepID=A0ABR1R491_9PEZI